MSSQAINDFGQHLLRLHFISSLIWEGFGQHILSIIFSPRRHERGLVNTCWNIFCVLAGMGWIWTKLVEMLFCLACDRFVQHMLRFFCVLAVMGRICSIYAVMHLVSLVSWDGFCQHMLSCIFCHCCHGRGFVNTCWDTVYVLAGMGWVFISTNVQIHFVCTLGWVWSTHVGIYFVFSLAWDGSGQNLLRCCSAWHAIGLFNTCWDSFCVLAVMGGICSIHAVMHLVSLVSWDGFCQHMLRCI